jgi:hypothetical protein
MFKTKDEIGQPGGYPNGKSLAGQNKERLKVQGVRPKAKKIS